MSSPSCLSGHFRNARGLRGIRRGPRRFITGFRKFLRWSRFTGPERTLPSVFRTGTATGHRMLGIRFLRRPGERETQHGDDLGPRQIKHRARLLRRHPQRQGHIRKGPTIDVDPDEQLCSSSPTARFDPARASTAKRSEESSELTRAGPDFGRHGRLGGSVVGHHTDIPCRISSRRRAGRCITGISQGLCENGR